MPEIIDLTRPLSRETLAYPGDSRALKVERLKYGVPGMTVSHLSLLDLHAATHIDAPLHFTPDGADVADLPLRLLPLRLIRASITLEPSDVPDDIAGQAVLIAAGWELPPETPAYFESFPFLTEGAAAALADRGAALVGVESPSVDPADASHDYRAHRILLGAGIPIVEGLCNLDRLNADTRYWFGAFGLPIRGAEASPVRAIAIVWNDDS